MIRQLLNILGWAGAAVVFAAFAIWIIPDTALPTGVDWPTWQRWLALTGLVLRAALHAEPVAGHRALVLRAPGALRHALRRQRRRRARILVAINWISNRQNWR